MPKAVNKTILKNGIRIVTKRMPYVRSVSMGVWVNVGARDETPAESGLSHLIEHMIFKGTRKRTAYQIAKEFDAIGGHTNAFTSMENTCYHAKVLDTHLESMVEILSDIFLNSLFDAREVERERPVILQEIGMVEDNPEDYIHVLSGRHFWGDNPLGRSVLGSRENVRGFDDNAIRDFFHRAYIPDRIVISAAGNLEHDHIIDIVGNAFEAVNPGNGFPDRITPKSRSGITLHQRDLEQVHICLGTTGLSITDPRRYAYSLLNTILGGNMSSRLFQEIRERRGLAYSVYAFIASHVDTGMFGVYAGVDPANARETVELIVKEIGRLKRTSVDPSELKGAVEYTKGNLLLASENSDSQMFRLAQNEFHFGGHIPLKEVVDKIDSVTREDIIELSASLFQSKKLALTMLGPVPDKEPFNESLTL